MKHRNLVAVLSLTALLTLSTANTASAQVCAGPFTLTSQAEVDAFSCISVAGNLRISGADITNLNGLAALTSVGGDLDMGERFSTSDYNPALTNLDGLAALTSVGGDLWISYNFALTNLDGLAALMSVGEHFHIDSLPDLENLDGLAALTSVVGDFTISNMDSLANLDGLVALTSVNKLRIYSSPLLTNLDGLAALTSAEGGYLDIRFNDALDNYCGLFALLDGGYDGAFVIGENATNPSEAEILAGGPCPASSAQVVTLDNFEEGAFSLSTPPGATFDEATQSGLSSVNVLSGERILLLDFLGSTNNPGASSSELVLTGGDDAASFTANSELGKRLEVIYSFAAPVDLTAMGSAFSIELESLVDSAAALSFLVGVESNGGFGESNVEVSGLTPGTITVPFSALVGVADLTQADSIFFQLRTTDGALGSVSATIDDLQIVPEPGTGLLQLTAMLVVAGLRRRSVRTRIFGFAQAA